MKRPLIGNFHEGKERSKSPYTGYRVTEDNGSFIMMLS